jgi:hypothetical protein
MTADPLDRLLLPRDPGARAARVEAIIAERNALRRECTVLHTQIRVLADLNRQLRELLPSAGEVAA